MVNAPNPAKEPENKDDYLFIANIEDFSELDIHLDDLLEVRGIDSTSRLLERLVFVYKISTDVIWPLHRVFKKGLTLSQKYFLL